MKRNDLLKQPLSKLQLILKAFIASLLLIWGVKTFAGGSALEFKHNAKIAIRAFVSETAPTRISFSGYRISEVIGDENKYKIITDSKGLNIFITPKVASGTVIPMTIIAGSNKVQDLLLEVSAQEKLPRSIVITSSQHREAGKGDELAIANASEIEQMLKVMMDGELEYENENEFGGNGKYYITPNKRKLTLPHLPKLLITQNKTWKFKGLTGASLVITNKGRVATLLDSKYLRDLFKNTKLTVIENNLLGKGGSTKAFVITEEGEEE